MKCHSRLIGNEMAHQFAKEATKIPNIAQAVFYKDIFYIMNSDSQKKMKKCVEYPI